MRIVSDNNLDSWGPPPPLRFGKLHGRKPCATEGGSREGEREYANCSSCATHRKRASETLRRNGTNRVVPHRGIGSRRTRRDFVCQRGFYYKCATCCVVR